MGYAGFGWGFGHGLAAMFAHIAGTLVFMIGFSILAGVLFVLLRFLIIGTRAAQLYIAKNEPQRPAATPSTPAASVTPATPVTPGAPSTSAAPATPVAKAAPKSAAKAAPKSAAASAAAKPAATKPAATKKRAPKAPPAS